MSCSWLYLASRTTPERFCDKLGHPYCPVHQCEIDAMEQADQNWDAILATHRAVCEESREERKLCAVCGRHPVHEDCIHCEECSADDSLGILGPRG